MNSIGRINVRIQPYSEKMEDLIPVFQELDRNKFGILTDNYYICPTHLNIQGVDVLNHMFQWCRNKGIESLMFILNDKKEENL